VNLGELDFGRAAKSRVRFGRGLLGRLDELLAAAPRRGVALVADAQVRALYGAPVLDALRRHCPQVLDCSFPPGEGSKSRETAARLQDELALGGIDRRCLVLGLGGGVALDLAGFVAATHLRGLDWWSLPTSLLAQVDAGLGGKTGVNTPCGKNLVGAFHPPQEVLIDPAALATLPAREWRNGLAEVVKHGWVAAPSLFERLEAAGPALAEGPDAALDLWLPQAAQAKIEVVAQDPFERGRRAILNAGHSVGHAVEAASGHAVAHGFGVALGLWVEARVARHLLGLPAADEARLLRLLRQLRLLPPLGGLTFAQLEPYLSRDKKNLGGTLRLALPRRLGEMEPADGSYALAVPLELLRQAWEETACSA